MMEEKYRTLMEKLNWVTKREEEKQDISKIVTCVLIVLGVLAAIGGIIYAIYRFTSDRFDDFEDDFEDDFDDEFFEDEEEASEKEEKEPEKESEKASETTAE